MKIVVAYLLIALLCGSCSRPVARFTQPVDVTAASIIKLKNESSSSTQFKWYLDEDFFSDEAEPEYIFTSSGRFILKLEASDGKKTDVYNQEVIVKAPKRCYVLVKTNLGDMIFALSEKTPRHMRNFLKQVNDEFYSGISFHRVISGFMIQAGDETQKKRSRFPEVVNEINSELPHYRGALAAARMPDNINPDKKSSGSQFYIVQGKSLSEEELLNYASENLWDYTQEQTLNYIEKGGAPQLDGNYTVFGYLVKGEEVLDAIASVKTDGLDKPLSDVIILEVKEIN